MIYLANTLLPVMRDWFYADKDGDAAGADAVRTLARRRIESAWDHLAARLAGGDTYFVGERLSAVDILAVMLLSVAARFPLYKTAAAHKAVEAGGKVGTVVVEPQR